MKMYREHNQITVGIIPEFFGSKYNTKNKIAVKSNDGFSITWNELNKRSNQFARIAKENFHLNIGDKVVTFLDNCGQYPEIIYGLSKIGVIVTPASFRFVPNELLYAIEYSEAKGIILSENLLPVFEQIKDRVPNIGDNILVIGNGKRANYEKILSTKDTSNVAIEVEENDCFIMAFTGGTTGYPKAALITHRSIIENWRRIALEFTILEDDYSLLAGPFYHTLGFLFGLEQLSVGGSVFILDKFNPNLVLTIMENERITATPMVPTMYNEILHSPGKENFDVSSMRVLVCAGSALLNKVKTGIMEFFSHAGLYEFYGSTEHGLYTVMKPKDHSDREGSCGLPFYGVEIMSLDDNGNEVKTGDVGEIYKKGLLLGAEYHNNKKATEDNFRGEWASSGDMGYVDEDGFLYIVDRKKDMIISGGVNIFPRDIEEAIQSHPAVKEVAVVGAPDEKWGEVVSAFVVVKEGLGLTKEGILDHCEGLISRIKKPKNITFLDQLPKSGAGKILRRELREKMPRNIE